MKQRIISAIIALLISIPVVIMGGKIYYIAISLLALLGLKELIGIRETKRKFPELVKLGSYIMLIILVLNNYNKDVFIYSIDYRIITALLFTSFIPLVLYRDNDKYNISDATFLAGSVFFLGLSFNLLILVRNYSIFYFVFLFLITIMTDNFAFITGLLIGKNKMIPSISPNKTWEGLIGGTVLAVVISSVYYLEAINSNISLIKLVLCITILSLVGQIGDLAFSSIKRYYNKKDFSNIMPGHGGILDRLDSIIFVILAFTLFITLI
jgi:phosphatidate cytidylyltransferase